MKVRVTRGYTVSLGEYEFARPEVYAEVSSDDLEPDDGRSPADEAEQLFALARDIVALGLAAELREAHQYVMEGEETFLHVHPAITNKSPRST